MKKTFIESIDISNYRNFQELNLQFGENVNIIYGKNGSGKTNILESISLLSPGRGLKSAKFEDICKFQSSGFWKTSFRLQSKLGVAEIATFFDKEKKSRKINYNGSKLSSFEFSNLLNVIWMTPQMENLFLGPSSNRRKFFDRIVFSFDKNHAKNLNKYDYFMRERNKIFKSKYNLSENSWIEQLEEKMAIEAKIIDDSRRKVIKYMDNTIENLDNNFPKAYLSISNLFDNEDKINDFIANYKDALKSNRKKDYYSGRTNFGIHKSDFIVFHAKKNMYASLCSTGEQKAMLISIILASIESMIKETKVKPILLLDELFVHLDKLRSNILSDYIVNNDMQTFITTTEVEALECLAKKSFKIKL